MKVFPFTVEDGGLTLSLTSDLQLENGVRGSRYSESSLRNYSRQKIPTRLIYNCGLRFTEIAWK